jgi:hypothetical protein
MDSNRPIRVIRSSPKLTVDFNLYTPLDRRTHHSLQIRECCCVMPYGQPLTSSRRLAEFNDNHIGRTASNGDCALLTGTCQFKLVNLIAR